MRTNKDKLYPGSIDELLAECEALIDRYDLYTLGEPHRFDDPEGWPDGAADYSGEWRYGVSMIPCQWVTNVIGHCHPVPMGAAGDPTYRQGDWICNMQSEGCSERGCPWCGVRLGKEES